LVRCIDISRPNFLKGFSESRPLRTFAPALPESPKVKGEYVKALAR